MLENFKRVDSDILFDMCYLILLFTVILLSDQKEYEKFFYNMSSTTKK